MIATASIIPSMKIKIKLPTKRVEVDLGTKCGVRQKASQVEENGFFNSKERSSVPGSNKRGPQVSIESQQVKRQKMDRKASVQCTTILKSLMSQKHSWVFNKPVDPVALNIPDYFTVISQPMDLGTIKSKLDKNIYFSIEEFAVDVRLTFSNAMTYNPPSNDVHLMAKDLNKLFERKWKDLEKKWKCEDEHEKSMTGTVRETVNFFCDEMHPLQKDTLPKKLRVPKPKRNQKISSLAGRDAKVKVLKSSRLPCRAIEKDLHKGEDNYDGQHPSGSVKACISSSLVTHKCTICDDLVCSCGIPSDPSHASSGISSEGSAGRDLNVDGGDALRPAYCKTPSQKKSDLDSDGADSSLDSEHLCSSSQLTTGATDASCGEVWSTPDFSVQLSPKKALRAAMLKSRFADTILKAQQKTLLDLHGDKSGALKMPLVKERMERIHREERARIEAQLKSAEVAARMKAGEEYKKQREREREAARVALQKMERSVEVENNLQCLKELEMLCGCMLSFQAPSTKNGSRVAIDTSDKSPLEQLGLFIKDEYVTADEDEEVLDCWEEGEILY